MNPKPGRAAPAAAAIVVILSTYSHSAGPKPSFKVLNEGEQVSVEIVKDDAPPPAPRPNPLDAITRDTSVTALLDLLRESYKPEEQARLLEAVAERRPRTLTDLRSLMGLFMKEDQSARAAAETSLRRLEPGRDAGFTPFFLNLLADQDPVVRLFGLIGVDRLRPAEALSSLLSVAKTPFEIPKPALNTAPKPANEWLFRYQTLDVLADWQGEKVFDILMKRMEEAPDVARLASTHYWEKMIPRLIRWSRSRKKEEQARAMTGWRGSPPVEALKSTRDRLWEVLDSKRYPVDVRHQAAVKFGLAAEDRDVDRILERRAKTSEDKIRVLYDAALFASRSEKGVPVLIEYLRSDPDASARAGALTQLSTMVSPERYRELLLEMAKNDSDPDNRARARKTLELSE